MPLTPTSVPAYRIFIRNHRPPYGRYAQSWWTRAEGYPSEAILPRWFTPSGTEFRGGEETHRSPDREGDRSEGIGIDDCAGAVTFVLIDRGSMDLPSDPAFQRSLHH